MLAFALTLSLAAAPPSSPDALALVRRYDAVMSPANFEAQTKMVATREDGTTRTYKMKTQKSGKDKLRAQFLEPASAKGQEMLRNGENLWLWMPNLKRAVRVASRDSFMGGDFNNADVLRVNYEADYQPSIETGDPAGDVLVLKAKAQSAAYDAIKLWMTRDKDPQPIKAEFYAASGKILRKAEFFDVKDFGGGLVRPSRIKMTNEISAGRSSEMSWEAITLKDEIPAQRFVLDDLGR
ncbi:MAG: outer membrane lipoprotein-sorting protein [Deltaproteobacteria bacterium]|nr:outer membrane lipoprotein-sorting protein [Deltaproteobacteria bacterium]